MPYTELDEKTVIRILKASFECPQVDHAQLAKILSLANLRAAQVRESLEQRAQERAQAHTEQSLLSAGYTQSEAHRIAHEQSLLSQSLEALKAQSRACSDCARNVMHVHGSKPAHVDCQNLICACNSPK